MSNISLPFRAFSYSYSCGHEAALPVEDMTLASPDPESRYNYPFSLDLYCGREDQEKLGRKSSYLWSLALEEKKGKTLPK